jgi:hypothetical protein
METVQQQPAVSTQQMTAWDETREAHFPALDVMREIVGKLQSEATRRVGLRLPIEQEWIEDLRQFHGFYDPVMDAQLRNQKRSRLFMNETRPKTKLIAAKLKNMLFPTDDRSWSIEPTPVPRMVEAAKKAAAAALQKADQEAEAQATAAADPNDPSAQQAWQQAQAARSAADQAATALHAQLEEARRRATMMQEEIDDQLVQCNYQAVKRKQIDIGCKLGTGVTKGPVTGDKVRRGWKRETMIDPSTGKVMVDDYGRPVEKEGSPYALDYSFGDQPAYRTVDLWNFFPDMNVADIDDGEGDYERHLFNKKQLRCLKNLRGFDKAAIDRLLRGKPNAGLPSYVAELRNIRGALGQTLMGDIYQAWEYSGPIEPDDARNLAIALNNPTMFEEAGRAETQLIELNAVVWFCDNEILKFSIYPYDSGDSMYSVWNFVKDDSSVFGYGMPRLLRDPQAALNAGWRTMMDNMGIAAGPQMIVNQSAVEPADGVNEFAPRKVWLAKSGWAKDNPPVAIISIDSHQGELEALIAICERFIDSTSGVPALAGGEQGTGVTKTAQGMAILMNSTNVVLQDPVKNFDDDVTVKDIRRLYDWNMQHSDKEEIKGDYDIQAHGSSVLLVREMQAQNLMMIALQLGPHPVYGPMLNNRELLKMLFQAHMIPSERVMLTDTQIDAILASAEAERKKQAEGQGSADR